MKSSVGYWKSPSSTSDPVLSLNDTFGTEVYLIMRCKPSVLNAMKRSATKCNALMVVASVSESETSPSQIA